MLSFEHQYWDKGITRLAGVDEAGRGPLAGPVVASAVILNQRFVESEQDQLLKGLTDSKQLTEVRRDHFYGILINSKDASIGIGMADVKEIDELNILRATHLAMARALQNIEPVPEYALVDGLAVKGLPCPSHAIIKGDSKSLSIAAASIIAKVTRDRIMKEMDKQYPRYGFAGHKGYGSRKHMQALFEYGPCSEHRMSFRPVMDAMSLKRNTGEDRGRIIRQDEFRLDP